MRALTVQPGTPNPSRSKTLLHRRKAMARCWCARWRSASAAPTMKSIEGHYGWAPPGQKRLILGHESLGRVERGARRLRRRRPGDLVVGIVRRPDPVPCPPAPPANGTCAATANIPSAASRIATAMAANNSASSRISSSRSTRRSRCSACCWSRRALSPRPGSRSTASARRAPLWQPRVALVTGAGPVGLLAALIGAQRGLDDACARSRRGRAPSPNWCAISAPPTTPAISGTLRARHRHRMHRRRTRSCSMPSSALRPTASFASPASSPAATMSTSISANLNRNMVLENDTVFGSVNANRRHYRDGRRCTGQSRQELAGARDHPPRAADALARGVRNTRRTTSKSCVDFAA